LCRHLILLDIYFGYIISGKFANINLSIASQWAKSPKKQSV